MPPVRRWLIEGLVIVASILIAFALDAWWDDHERGVREREALVALADELRGAAIELDSVMAFNEGRVEAATYFLSLEPEDAERVPVDSVAFALGAAGGGLTFDPSLGATEAIIATGLDVVSNVELRARIAAWPGVLREIAVDQAAIVERWEKAADAQVRAGLSARVFRLYNSDSAEEDEFRRLLAAMVGDDPIRQRVAALGFVVEELQYELRDVEGRLERLRTGINQELGKGPPP